MLPVLSFGTCTYAGRILLLVGAIADALGVDVPALPVVATAPEYMEQKAASAAKLAVETNAKEAVAAMLAHINGKRAALGI